MLLSNPGESQSQLPPFKIKVEPGSEPMALADHPDSSALENELSRGPSDGDSGRGAENTKGSRPSNEDNESDRRVRPRVSQDDEQPASQRNTLPKPVHTVSSQSTSAEQGPSLWKKRPLSKQGKNTRNLTIFAPSYSDPSTTLGIRSAPLNSNFFHHQGQSHIQGQHYRDAPQTGTLHAGHTLAPLLSPRAPINMASTIPEGTSHSPRKQEFVIPPIVPSQQQPPPLSAQQLNSHPYIASPYGHHPRGYPNFTNGANSAQLPAISSGGGGNGSTPLPSTANAVPLPPKTPTTTSFAALQKQQFLQPFEHLFETIETTRTLKTTLDEQIRRSATLMQTLQASSTTIEGLVRNQVKEARKDMMTEMESVLQDVLSRVERLERQADRLSGQERHTTPVSSTRSNGNRSPTQTSFSGGNQTPAAQHLQSPPTIVRSQNDIGPREYHGLLNALRERLDRLERQLDT